MNTYASSEYGKKSSDEVSRMVGLIVKTEEWFEKNRSDEIIRNMSYYRGSFWSGEGSIGDGSSKGYSAERNEIFPIVDTIVSSLAMDIPQIEIIDQREGSFGVPSRSDDESYVGRRVASSLNWFASEDSWDSMIQELVLHAELFDEGGVAKISWSPALGRPICRVKMPWEVHFDPNARRIQDASWAFERFVIHFDDLKQRFEDEVYKRPTKSIAPDTYPRTIIDSRMPYEDEQKLRKQGLKEYVSLVEFWDFRKKKVYHLHPDTRQVLMEVDSPYGRPYEVLTFHEGVGRIRGISDVSLIASTQRDINELVSARREIVGRLPRRMLVDKGLFRSEEEWERFKSSRSWEPTLVEAPPDLTIDQRIYVTPEMPTTFDFNQHLLADIEHVRWVPGMADYQHGQVKNIRTAAEANMVRSSIEGRLNIRSRRLVRIVTNLFRKMLETYRWAIRNPESSGVDVQYVWSQTQSDISIDTYVKEVLEESPKFRLLPFSPLMEDKIARRENFNMLLQAMSGTPMADHFNWREVAREIQDLYGFRPSIIAKEQPAPEAAPSPEEMAALQAEMAGAAPAGAPPLMALPGMPEAAG
tara:strand:+ start:1406 stop:3157 length:1752 start_codon:yes stop_codon:yes gene_type:complete